MICSHPQWRKPPTVKKTDGCGGWVIRLKADRSSNEYNEKIGAAWYYWKQLCVLDGIDPKTCRWCRWRKP